MDLHGAGVSDSRTLVLKMVVPKARAIHISARAVIGGLIVVLAGALVTVEISSSWFESRIFSAIDRRVTYSVQPGPSPEVQPAAEGPYDRRLGFSELPGFAKRLAGGQFEIAAQARTSPAAALLSAGGIFPIYHEKSQAGLTIKGQNGGILRQDLYPARVYPDYYSIPPIVVNTLLFIENRQLHNGSYANRNPAIEWGRTGKAVIDLAVHAVNSNHQRIGGSTLATQLEKMRHSTGGQTQSVTDKARQIMSASLRAYLNGPDTGGAEERIVCDYINSVPLAATPAEGEVIGLADGLKAWYGADFDAVNGALWAREETLGPRQMKERAVAYRKVLSLILALRAPSWYLLDHPGELANQTDRYIRVLAVKGIISTRLRNLALRAKVQPKGSTVLDRNADFVTDKAPNAVRMELLPMLGLDNTYALDRLDLSVMTTLDKPAEDSITRFLVGLSDPKRAAAAGLNQYQLLEQNNPAPVIYSVTLYEHSGGANLLRVQTDNLNQPLDINQGTKLQLGSTAKLRILIHYLQIISELRDRYGNLTDEELRNVNVPPGDKLTAWTIEYLLAENDRSLPAILEAALQRKYSGNPGEAFFTAGGLQSFENFDRTENSRLYTVGEGFQLSVNLVYIRLLRDIERYYRYRVPGASPNVLADAKDPARRRYLERFADMEGRVFLRRFYDKYKGQTPDQALETLVSGIHLTSLRGTVIYRSIRPNAGIEEMRAFLEAHLPKPVMARVNVASLYDKYGPDKFNLQDRGYLARVHPLELWLLEYRQQHPKATLAELYAASVPERKQAYEWLYKLRFKHAQDSRIQTMMEIDSFKQIHKAWAMMGYPFDSLVPSYATAIGVSGDTPAALAKLVGIILNDGVLYPTVSIEQMHFAAGTPFETVMKRRIEPGKQVLDPLIAKLVRGEMIGVVRNGTARRLQGGLKLPGGRLIPVGGKTGTGDNQFRVYGARGALLGSRAVNRTAAFTFFIGDRFFGTVLAFVPGSKSNNYEFTSALAVQVLKAMSPELVALVGPAQAQMAAVPAPVPTRPAVAPEEESAPLQASPVQAETPPAIPQEGGTGATTAEPGAAPAKPADLTAKPPETQVKPPETTLTPAETVEKTPETTANPEQKTEPPPETTSKPEQTPPPNPSEPPANPPDTPGNPPAPPEN